MALSDDIALNNSAAASKTFKLQSNVGLTSTRIESTSDVTQPRVIKIAHESRGTGPDQRFDHLIQYTNQKRDATTGKQYTLNVSMTIKQPLSGGFTRTDIDDGIAFVKNLVAGGNVDQLLRNEC